MPEPVDPPLNPSAFERIKFLRDETRFEHSVVGNKISDYIYKYGIRNLRTGIRTVHPGLATFLFRNAIRHLSDP
jgi:hypothetical protein